MRNSRTVGAPVQGYLRYYSSSNLITPQQRNSQDILDFNVKIFFSNFINPGSVLTR